MCGRFTLKTPAKQLLMAFGLAEMPGLTPRYNIAPTQMIPVVRAGERGRQMELMQWSLVPSWAKEPKLKAPLINARAETVAELPAFRSSFRQRRCLIPADGYYEWLGAKKQRQPYWVHLADERPFAMAGLWDLWRPATGDPLASCTIITTDANGEARTVHDRMPVILDPADYDEWLNPAEERPERLLTLLRPYEGDLVVDRVNPLVNKADNESPECLVAPRQLF